MTRFVLAEGTHQVSSRFSYNIFYFSLPTEESRSAKTSNSQRVVEGRIYRRS